MLVTTVILGFCLLAANRISAVYCLLPVHVTSKNHYSELFGFFPGAHYKHYGCQYPHTRYEACYVR